MWKKGYEHRWTPSTPKQVFETMSQQPHGLLEKNRAARNVAPAGLVASRIVSPLDMRMSFGTANGQMSSELPRERSLRTTYHFNQDFFFARDEAPALREEPQMQAPQMPSPKAMERKLVKMPSLPLGSPTNVTMSTNDWAQREDRLSSRTERLTSRAVELVQEARQQHGSGFMDHVFDPSFDRHRFNCHEVLQVTPRRLTTLSFLPEMNPDQQSSPGLKTKMSSPRHESLSPMAQPWGCIDHGAARNTVKGFERGTGPLPPFSAAVGEFIMDARVPPKPLLEPMHRLRLLPKWENQANMSTLNIGMFRPSKEFANSNPAGVYTQRAPPPGRRR